METMFYIAQTSLTIAHGGAVTIIYGGERMQILSSKETDSFLVATVLNHSLR